MFLVDMIRTKSKPEHPSVLALAELSPCLALNRSLQPPAKTAWQPVVARGYTKYADLHQAEGLQLLLSGAVHAQGASLAKTAAPQVRSRLGLENVPLSHSST